MGDVEFLRRLYGYNWASLASAQEGLAAILDAFDAGFEYRLPAEMGRTLRGVAGIRTFLEAVEEDFSELRQEASEFVEVGEQILVLGELRGQGRVSGLPFHCPFGHLWTVRDGRALVLESFLDHAQARQAAGALAS